jgi:hypothetical protein
MGGELIDRDFLKKAKGAASLGFIDPFKVKHALCSFVFSHLLLDESDR